MEPERQEAIAPAPPAPATAAPAPLAAGPVSAGPAGLGHGSLGAGNAPVRPRSAAHVLALQRAAGNQAVSSLLQREDKPKEKAAGPGDFGVSGGEPQYSGTTNVHPAGNDLVEIQSPKVTYSVGEIWLQDGKTLETSGYAGIVQNLTESDRGTVYRRGGTEKGDVISESHEGLSKKWDAVSDPKAEKEKGVMEPHKGVFPPFYWEPTSIDQSHVKGSGAKTDAAAHDQPSFQVPAKKGPGRITEFKGKDQFKMGLAVKHDAAVWMLKAYDWSVSWNAKVDENLNGAGEAVNSSAIKDIIKDGPDTSLTDWSLTAKHDAFEGFSTVEEAMKRSPDELLKWIFAAKAHDQVTYRNICAALDAKDPTFSVKVECETTKDLVGRDHVHIRAEGGNSGASAGKTVKLKKGESDSIGLTMKELFGSAGGISSGAKLKVEVQHLDGPEGSAEFGAPFAGSKKIAVDSGSYTATVSLG